MQKHRQEPVGTASISRQGIMGILSYGSSWTMALAWLVKRIREQPRVSIKSPKQWGNFPKSGYQESEGQI